VETEPTHPTSRFSNRVADYVRCRPSYPHEAVVWLKECHGLRAGQIVADIGAGTGIFSRMLVDEGCQVLAVEPNSDMRKVAEESLGGYSAFRGVDGTAEVTTLPGRSADWITAAQSFHWVDVERARTESLRILRRPPMAALLWNNRREDTPFLAEYERFLHEFAVDYARVKHQNAESDGRIQRYFGRDDVDAAQFEYLQRFDLEGLLGRTASASYMPAQDHPRFPEMVSVLHDVFVRHSRGGQVEMTYDTRVYAGPIKDS